MSTRRGTRNRERGESVGTSAGPASQERLDSRLTGLAIDQALAELGIHAKLSDMVAKARSIENGVMHSQSRSRRKLEHLC